MPVEKPTKVAFGGPGLDVLYVTSIGTGLTPGTEARQPQAGGIFATRVPGVVGVAQPQVRRLSITPASWRSSRAGAGRQW